MNHLLTVLRGKSFEAKLKPFRATAIGGAKQCLACVQVRFVWFI